MKMGLLYQPLEKLQKILDETESKLIERKTPEEFMNKSPTGRRTQSLGFDNKRICLLK